MSFNIFFSSLFLDSSTDEMYCSTAVVRGSTEFLASNAHDYVFSVDIESSMRFDERKKEERGKRQRRAMQNHLIQIHPVNAASHRGQ